MRSTDLTDVQRLLLDVLAVSLRGENAVLPAEMGWDELCGLLRLADGHHVLALVCETICGSELICAREASFAPFRGKAIASVAAQVERTARFQALYSYLADQGLRPVVVKGIVLRELYPRGNFRPSTDEDLWILPTELETYHRALCAFGFVPEDPEQDAAKEPELAYRDTETRLYIELHMYPFPPDSEIYGHFNRFFTADSITVPIHGQTLRTLPETEHLLFLFLHLFKHFVHGGFGIRQVCDIALYSEHYRHRIDWDDLRTKLESAHALDFARALYRIADRYLTPENHMAEYLAEWDIPGVDETPLLLDILDSGAYGLTLTRLHSSHMTLRAASAGKTDVGGSTLRWLFPARKSMEGRYPYLKKAPYLLPLTWAQRVCAYLAGRHREDHSSAASDAAESIRLGADRVRLLKTYHII